MGPPAPELTPARGSCSFSLGLVTQRARGTAAAGSLHMALDSGKGASPAEAKPLSGCRQPHNGGASAGGWRVTGVWERICPPHLTAQITQVILLPLREPGKTSTRDSWRRVPPYKSVGFIPRMLPSIHIFN